MVLFHCINNHYWYLLSQGHHEERFVICFMCHKWFHYILVYYIIFSFNQIGYTPAHRPLKDAEGNEICKPAPLRAIQPHVSYIGLDV